MKLLFLASLCLAAASAFSPPALNLQLRSPLATSVTARRGTPTVPPRRNVGTKAILPVMSAAAESSAALDASSAPVGNILVLDHLNINHEKGRHDLLKAFYFEVLGCAVDPRKEENLAKGKKTLWANAGINQFHLPEADEAQVFAGTIVLRYKSLDKVLARLQAAPAVLSGTKFGFRQDAANPGVLHVTCPWGNSFELWGDAGASKDPRGTQPGEESEPLGMPELRVDVPFGSDIGVIERFYTDIMAAPTTRSGNTVTVHCGAGQKLIFVERGEGEAVVHSDYHVSMYIEDLPGAFARAEERGLIFVNPRFKRKARTLEEAIDQCMFRVVDMGVIQLEHEIRATKTKTGEPYKSCPFVQ